MLKLRRTMLPLTCAFAALLVPAVAHADIFPGGFRLESPQLYVHERDGAAVITVLRDDVTFPAQIRYIVIGITATNGVDYTGVKGEINFDAGQSSATFSVPIVDHGLPLPSRTIEVSLFGPSPIGMDAPSKATLTIINDDPLSITRNPLNPLALAASPNDGNPLSGAQFYVDHVWGYAARQSADWRDSHPGWANLLGMIANQPGTHRFGGWDGPDPGPKVSQFLSRAAFEQPGAVPMIASYALAHRRCDGYSDSASAQAAFHDWITGLARGIAGYRAVLFLEMDAVITVGCLSNHGAQVRLAELRDALKVLTTNCPRLVVYLDAGAADAGSASGVASLLRRAGVAMAQGFFLNSTHFDWTSSEIRYGRAISRMTGGKHFVVNTGVNGQGPLAPADRVRAGNEVLCNPPRRGLGPKPTSSTGYAKVDAFAWTSNPGESGGPCVAGAPPAGTYWPQYAMDLVRHADFRVR